MTSLEVVSTAGLVSGALDLTATSPSSNPRASQSSGSCRLSPAAHSAPPRSREERKQRP
jgi:hypothetical protein